MSQPDDPERLASGSPRSPLGDLLASAARDVPSHAQLALLAERLGPLRQGAAPQSALQGSRWLKLGAVAGVAGMLVGGALAVRHASRTPLPDAAGPAAGIPAATARREPEPSEPSLPAPAPVSAAAREEARPELLPSGPVLPLKASDKSADAPRSAPKSDSALSEPALLEQARRVLGRSPGSALQLTQQHALHFPHGVLSQEREVIAIEALRRLKRTAEADQRAAAFARAYPSSAHRRMVDDSKLR